MIENESWREVFEITAADLGVTVDDLRTIGLDWLSEACVEMPADASAVLVIAMVEENHLGGWEGFLQDDALRDALACLAIERTTEPVTVYEAAELLRVPLIDVAGVLADVLLKADERADSTDAGAPRIWDRGRITVAALRMLRDELVHWLVPGRGAFPRPTHLAAARSWIDDCDYSDMRDLDLTAAGLTDDEVLAGIDRDYAGGWPQFIADLVPVDLSRERANTSNRENEEF